MTAKQPEGIIINLELTNDAFFQDLNHETARILRELADHIEQNGPSERPLRDYNGNTIGHSRLTYR